MKQSLLARTYRRDWLWGPQLVWWVTFRQIQDVTSRAAVLSSHHFLSAILTNSWSPSVTLGHGLSLDPLKFTLLRNYLCLNPRLLVCILALLSRRMLYVTYVVSNILFPTWCSAGQRWRPNSQPWRANDQKVIETAGGWLKASLQKPNKGLEFDPQNLGKGRQRDLIPRSCPLTFICVLTCAPPHKHTQSFFLIRMSGMRHLRVLWEPAQ